MTTKKELIEEWTTKKAVAEKRLAELEKEYDTYSDVKRKFNKLMEDRDKVEEKITKLVNSQYLGNWGLHDNWYHSRIPEEIAERFKDYEREDIREALTQIAKKNKEKIEESEEYINLSKESDRLEKEAYALRPKRLDKLEDEMEEVGRSINWFAARLIDVENRGWFITYCKDIKKYDEIDERRNRHKKAVEELIEKLTWQK